LLRLAIACYSAPSRLALDAHCSPKKAQFVTFRGIYLMRIKVCHHVYSIKLGKIAYSGKPEIIKNDKEKLRELFL
jgi:hypothetical protein